MIPALSEQLSKGRWKARFYRAVEEASAQCHPTGLPPADIEDAEIAEATSSAAMKIVLERADSKQDDRTADFMTDAYATVAVAYHRAAGVYITDPDLQELGTAAVHLLTIATSYVKKALRWPAMNPDCSK